MAKRRVRAHNLVYVLAGMSAVLTIALLVGWTLLLLADEAFNSIPVMVVGIVSYGVVLLSLAALVAFFVRERRELARQVTFLDSVSHELKTPLASLLLELDTLERPDLTDAQREGLRASMRDDVARLASFIDDVLQASRVVHGQRSYSVDHVELATVLSRCADDISRRRNTERALIAIEVRPGLGFDSDPVALETIARNLIDNAVKYSPHGGAVRVAAGPSGRTITLTVSDQGIGIPKEHLSRVTERFFRVPSAAVSQRPGTGLGLFVVAGLVRSLGGTLTIDSRGPDQGTTVIVSLPRDQHPSDDPSSTA